MNNREFIAAHRARTHLMKSTRLKPTPLATRADFEANIDALLALEAQQRKIAAERDAELLAVTARYDERLAPIELQIKGRLALLSAYAETHRAELLPGKDSKSTTIGLARVGWRIGNRAVVLMSKVTTDHVINALKAIGLDCYVAKKEEIARQQILADCKDDKTLQVEAVDPCGQVVVQDGKPVTKTVPLAEVGLRIKQEETFYIEPLSEDGKALKAEAA